MAAGATYTTTLTGDLSKVRRLQAGVPYTVQAKLWLWHQGTLAQLDTPGVLSRWNLTTTDRVTVR